jgi:stage II sporulation protein D
LPVLPSVNVTRRQLLGLLGSGALVVLAANGRAFASPGPATLPGGRGAQSVTAGPPTIPATIKLRLADGSYCSTDMETYLKGVVPAEAIPSWSVEALKAQAVAARTYAAAYVATYGYICTTSACQNWNPALRTTKTDQVVDATRGELMTYQGGMIWAYYGSTCGGQTCTSPDAAAAYCVSVLCGTGQPTDLSSEGAAAAFWKSTSVSAYCSGSSLFRWSWTVSPRSVEEAILDKYLPAAGVGYQPGQLGTLTDLAVTNRAYSGKATNLRVNNRWNVTAETAIKSVLRSSLTGGAQPSANVVLSLDKDNTGTITAVHGWGGGFGHGIGLCQYGAQGMALAGSDYHAILQHYYSGVAFTIVTPSSGRVPASGPFRLFVPSVASNGGGCT